MPFVNIAHIAAFLEFDSQLLAKAEPMQLSSWHGACGSFRSQIQLYCKIVFRAMPTLLD
jgi:hypothetical protein